MEMYMDVTHFPILNYLGSEFQMKNELSDISWKIFEALKQIHKPDPEEMDYIQNSVLLHFHSQKLLHNDESDFLFSLLRLNSVFIIQNISF